MANYKVIELLDNELLIINGGSEVSYALGAAAGYTWAFWNAWNLGIAIEAVNWWESL